MSDLQVVNALSMNSFHKSMTSSNYTEANSQRNTDFGVYIFFIFIKIYFCENTFRIMARAECIEYRDISINSLCLHFFVWLEVCTFQENTISESAMLHFWTVLGQLRF